MAAKAQDEEEEDISLINKNFGESHYGDRLDYSSPKYNDLWCAIIYYIQLLIVAGLIFYFLPEMSVVMEENDAFDSTTDDSDQIEFSFSGLLVSFIVCCSVGLILGFIWLKVLAKYGEKVIKIMLFSNLLLWIILIGIGFVTAPDGLGLAIFGIIFVLIFGIYIWCIWKRIRFAGILLSLGSTIISQFSGTVFLSLFVIGLTILWIFIWSLCFGGYLCMVMNNATETTNESGETIYEYNYNVFVIFLLVLSLYWALQVNTNIMHTTACGVAASWYFTPPSRPSVKVVSSAFKRTMTTSFGSICLGSFFVAILQAIKFIARMGHKKDEDGKKSVLRCLVICFAGCLEKCMKWFNTYAFAHCAIYGSSYVQSASKTMDLLSSRGVFAIINEDLSGLGIMVGSMISLVICALVGGFIGLAFNPSDINYNTIVMAIVIGGISGFMLTLLVLQSVRSAIIALFVCFAEEPSALYEYRRDEFDKLAEVQDDFTSIYTKWGVRISV